MNSYNPTKYVDYPSTETIVDAQKLNKSEDAIKRLAEEKLDLINIQPLTSAQRNVVTESLGLGNLDQKIETIKTNTQLSKEYSESAKNSENKAKEYSDKAFHTTPAGYEKLVETVDDLGIKTTEYITEAELHTGEGAILINGIKGKTHKSPNLINVNDFVNNTTDTRSQFQIQFYAKKNGNNHYKSLAAGNQDVGLFSVTVDLTEGVDGLYLKHNGSQMDFVIVNENIPLKGIYTFSMNVVSANPTVVGGLKIENIQLEAGSQATPFEKFGITSAGQLGLVDLGELDWDRSTYGNATVFAAAISNIKPHADGTKKANLYCEYYRNEVANNVYGNRSDKIICLNGTNIIIIDDSFTDVTSFKNAVKGTMLAYELAEGSTADKYALAFDEHGKNFLNPAFRRTTAKNNVTLTYKDGTYILNGTASANTGFMVAIYMPLAVGKRYKLLGTPSTGNANTYMHITDNVSKTYYDRGNGVEFTNNIEYEKARVYIEVLKDTTCNNLVFKPMITEDLTATYDDFVPYQSKASIIPLANPIRSVNDVYDEITKQNGQWGVLRRFGIVDMGSLNWGRTTWGISTVFFAAISNIKPHTDVNIKANLCCEYYRTETASNMHDITSDKTICYSENIIIIDNSFTDATSFKNAVSGQYLIYELATPYFEPFTDESVMYQLEAYTNKTYIRTAEGLAEFSLKYGESETSSQALVGYYGGKKAEAVEKMMFMEDITSKLSKVSTKVGSYGNGNVGYRFGNMINFNLNFNLTSNVSSGEVLFNVPIPEHVVAFIGVGGNGTGVKFALTQTGAIQADGAVPSGWYNATLIYKLK